MTEKKKQTTRVNRKKAYKALVEGARKEEDSFIKKFNEHQKNKPKICAHCDCEYTGDSWGITEPCCSEKCADALV